MITLPKLKPKELFSDIVIDAMINSIGSVVLDECSSNDKDKIKSTKKRTLGTGQYLDDMATYAAEEYKDDIEYLEQIKVGRQKLKGFFIC